MGFAAGEAAYSRWRLDGSNLVARLRVEDAAAPIGYDPSGSYLLVESLVPDRPEDGTASYGVVEVATNEQVVQVPACGRVRVGRRGDAGLLGAGRGGLLDVESEAHRRRPGAGGGDGERVRRPPGRDMPG